MAILLPRYHQLAIANVYQSENQIDNYNYTNSPIDYLQGNLCPVFCVCKSISYGSKWLKYNILREYVQANVLCYPLLRFANFGGLVIIRLLPKSHKILPKEIFETFPNPP